MDLPHLRSLLFAPGSDERKLAKALSSSSDAVVCDLEDAVAPGDKEAAREVTAAVLAQDGTPARLVRINAARTPWFEDDLAFAAGLDLDGIVLPKSSPESVELLGSDGPPVVAIIETAMGLRQAFEIASQPRVAALTLGAGDLGADVGLERRPDAQEILYARSKVAIDSAAAGLRGPFDVAHVDFGDPTGLESQCRLARALGFRGKVCLDAGHVETINQVFASDELQVESAPTLQEAGR
jgi:citrate lyase subunit beta/citryl-CoA lyase